MRSEGNDAVVDCDDPMTVIACTTNTDACPAACKEADEKEDTVVKAGSLELTARPEDGRKVIADAVTSYLDTLTLKVSEDVTVNSITLERYGYSTTADVDKIWLEDSEGNIISSEKSLSPSKDSVTLSLKKDYRTFSNKDTITIAVKTAAASSFADDATHGTNIGFKVTDVECSAKEVDLDDYSAYLYDIIDYAGSEVIVKLMGKDGKSYNVGAGEYYEVAKLKVTATNSAINVNGFTLTNGGANKLDLSDNVEDVKVKIDGEEVKATYSIKKDTLKVNFSDANIGIKKSSLFTVSVSLKDEFEDYNDQVTFYLANTSDLRATETKNGTTVKFEPERSAYGLDDAYTYTFVGGKVTLTNVKLASSIEAAAGSSDVVVAQGTVKLGGEPINIESLTITPSVNDAELNVANIVEAIKVYVDDEEFEAGNDGVIKDILIEKDATIKVAVDLEDDPDAAFAGKTLTFKIGNSQSINATTLDAENGNVEYDNSGEAVAKANIAGSITISTIKVNESSASLKNSVTKEAEFVKGQTTTKTIFDGTYTAKKSDVDLNEVALILGGAGFINSDAVSINVIVDGDTVATLDATDLLPANTVYDDLDDEDFVDFSDVTVKAGKSVSVKVVAEIYADNSEDAEETFVAQKMTLVLRGDDANGIAAGKAKATTVKLKLTDSESIKVVDSAAKKTVVLQDSDILLAQFRVKPSNTSDEVDLTKLVLNFTNFGDNLDVDDLEVTVDDDPITLEDDYLADGVLTLENISYTVPSEGVLVEVTYTAELAASDTPYLVKLANANTSSPNTEFSRYVVPALVTLDQQDMNGATKFTVNVEKFDESYEVTDLQLVIDGIEVDPLDEVSDGAIIEVNGLSAGAKFVTNINYKVTGLVDDEGEPAEDATVEIAKATYNDFFRYGDTYLKVFKAD